MSLILKYPQRLTAFVNVKRDKLLADVFPTGSMHLREVSVHLPLRTTNFQLLSGFSSSVTVEPIEPSASSPSGIDSSEWLQRSELLLGSQSLATLSKTRVLLVGLGGVGSFAAEFLCRAGVGVMTIVDGDVVSTSNRNRQLPALASTVGQSKVLVMAQRLRDINPDMQLTALEQFLDPERADEIVGEGRYDYVVDCIDSVAPKASLIIAARRAGVPVVSSMGAGGRVDPSKVSLVDISQTFNDPFAALIRKTLRQSGIHSGVTVVFSDELPIRSSLALTDEQQKFKRSYFGTVSYMPALFGLNLAAYIVNHAIKRPLPRRNFKAVPRKEVGRGVSNGVSSDRMQEAMLGSRVIAMATSNLMENNTSEDALAADKNSEGFQDRKTGSRHSRAINVSQKNGIPHLRQGSGTKAEMPSPKLPTTDAPSSSTSWFMGLDI